MYGRASHAPCSAVQCGAGAVFGTEEERKAGTERIQFKSQWLATRIRHRIRTTLQDAQAIGYTMEENTTRYVKTNQRCDPQKCAGHSVNFDVVASALARVIGCVELWSISCCINVRKASHTSSPFLPPTASNLVCKEPQTCHPRMIDPCYTGAHHASFTITFTYTSTFPQRFTHKFKFTMT